MSWYPLGRPVGTTIYPGMQFTAVFIKEYIVGDSMSLNDVCCYIPAWFGVIATFITGLIAYECTLECNSSNTILSFISSMIFINSNANENEIDNGNGNGNSKLNSNSKNSKEKSDTTLIPILSMLFAMMAMAVIPAHLMRSVGGGFDNESVAMSAMTMTFYFWVRSLRTGEDKSYLWGVLTGLAYFYVSTCHCKHNVLHDTRYMIYDWHYHRGVEFLWILSSFVFLYSPLLSPSLRLYNRWWQHGEDMSLS